MTREIRAEISHHEKVRKEVKLASGDYIDMKMYEPAMRHLLDTYIRAEESEQVSVFDDMTLVQLIVERREKAVDALPEGIHQSHEAVAETIENNVRRLIIDETAVNPKYYQRMSELLDALILQRREEAMDYKEYLAKIVDLTVKVSKPETQSSYPASINTTALRSLFDNLGRFGPLTVGDQPSPYEFDGSSERQGEKGNRPGSCRPQCEEGGLARKSIQGTRGPYCHQVSAWRGRGPRKYDIRDRKGSA